MTYLLDTNAVIMIAAQALRTRATLVTANVSEFGRVPDLLWQDWTA